MKVIFTQEETIRRHLSSVATLLEIVLKVFLVRTGKQNKKKCLVQGIPWWPMVRILGFHCHGPGTIPGRRTEPSIWQEKKKKSLSRGITCSSNKAKLSAWCIRLRNGLTLLSEKGNSVRNWKELLLLLFHIYQWCSCNKIIIIGALFDS